MVKSYVSWGPSQVTMVVSNSVPELKDMAMESRFTEM
jgi:hypothetical protein